MTTAAASYLADHLASLEGRGYAVFNPHSKPVAELPAIYGFNNGGSSWMLHGVLIAEDGEALGGHGCSDEAYMPHDLGILEGTRPDRHETFRGKYPDGYRMEFVSYGDVEGHAELNEALVRHAKRQVVAA